MTWLVLICLAIAALSAFFLLGFGFGMSIGTQNERERWLRIGEDRGWFGH